jgi:hypothetical protein
MPINGMATSTEKDALCEQLALLYMEKADTSGLTPAKFTERYLEVKSEISSELSGRSKL